MITRTMDATFLNEVANHPEVRPFLGGRDDAGELIHLDLTEKVRNPANIALLAPDGGWLLQAMLPGVYELHTLFLPSGRGRSYFARAKEALRYVFTRTDALEILTKVPDDNAGARMAAALVGFRERFRREGVWETGCGVSFQALTLDDWLARDPVIRQAGHEFHETLEAAKRAAGSELPTHPDDEAHDRVVGACYLMAQAGFVAKAVGIYGRWAAFAGYAPIEALAPNVLDVRDAVVEIDQGEMKVLLVR